MHDDDHACKGCVHDDDHAVLQIARLSVEKVVDVRMSLLVTAVLCY